MLTPLRHQLSTASSTARRAAQLVATLQLLPTRPQRPATSCDSRTTGRQQREARAGCQHQTIYDDTEHACATASVINLVSPDLVPPSLPRRRALREANPIDAETDQAREGKHRQRVILLD